AYGQIEKELLAIVFGMHRFEYYTYGRPVEVHSDHKPLEAIFLRPMHLCPKRLQSMRMRLQKFDVKIRYKKGSEMYIADTLSRATSKNFPRTVDEISNSEEFIFEFEQVSPLSLLPVSDSTVERLRTETEKDPTLQGVI